MSNPASGPSAASVIVAPNIEEPRPPGVGGPPPVERSPGPPKAEASGKASDAEKLEAQLEGAEPRNSPAADKRTLQAAVNSAVRRREAANIAKAAGKEDDANKLVKQARTILRNACGQVLRDSSKEACKPYARAIVVAAYRQQLDDELVQTALLGLPEVDDKGVENQDQLLVYRELFKQIESQLADNSHHPELVEQMNRNVDKVKEQCRSMNRPLWARAVDSARASANRDSKRASAAKP